MPTVTVVERLPYSVIVKFIADCGFRPEQVKGMPEPGSPLDAYIKACLSAGRKDIEDLRLCEPDPRYAPGGWTGPEDEKPEGMMQA